MGKILGETVEVTIGIKYDENGDIHIYFRGDEHDIQPVTVRGKPYERDVPEEKSRRHVKLYERLQRILDSHGKGR